MKPLPLPEWIDYYAEKGKTLACRDCNRVYVREQYAVMHAVGHNHTLSTIDEIREECQRYHFGNASRAGHRYFNAVGDVCIWCQRPREGHE